MAKAVKKDQGKDQGSSLVSKGLVFGSDEAKLATTNQSSLSIDFKKDVNVFVIASALFFPERVHYAKFGNETTRAVCGIHANTDIGVIVSGRGEEHCPQCAEVQKVWASWRTAKSEGNKVWQEELKKVAKDFGSVLSYYFIGAEVEFQLIKKAGKSIIDPYIPKGTKLKWTLLSFTADTFKKFENAFTEAKLDSSDLIGCPLVFHIGSPNDGNSFRSVQTVEILNKKRIDVPTRLPVNFDKLGNVDQSALETMAENFQGELEGILSGEKKTSSKASKKSAPKKKSKR